MTITSSLIRFDGIKSDIFLPQNYKLSLEELYFLHFTDINLTIMLSLSETIWSTLSAYFSLPTADNPLGVNSSGQYLHNTFQVTFDLPEHQIHAIHALTDTLVTEKWSHRLNSWPTRCENDLHVLFLCLSVLNKWTYILCRRVGISFVGIFRPFFFFFITECAGRQCWLLLDSESPAWPVPDSHC